MSNFNLDTPLLRFGEEADTSAFTIRSACEGALILGNTGGGKTSGSGRTLALKYLKHGFGGLVLTVKRDEVDSWKEYCRLAGRENDLIVVEHKGKHYFNFLEYESTVQSELSYAQNLLQMLKTIIQASQDRSSGKSDDRFWEDALELYISNIINLCLMAYGKVTVQLLYDIAQSAPKQKAKPSEEEAKGRAGTSQAQSEAEKVPEETPYTIAMKTVKASLTERVEKWKKGYTEAYFRSLSFDAYRDLLNDAIPEYRMLYMVQQFFKEGLFRISDKTRSIIDFSLTAFLNRLLSDPIYTLFCNKRSTFTPESCLSGKIIVINLPVKIYDKVGQDAQTLIKYIFQRAWERRNISANDRPLFLWSDEAQFFLHPHDTIFQTTARSSRIAVVYLSQNLPGFYANMGGGDGKKFEYKVKSFLGTLSTKIFHANNCTDTNEFASALIGQAYTEDISSGVSVGENPSISTNSAYSLEHIVRPENFSRLRTGGPFNKYVVDAYIHCQGKLFKNGCNHLKIQFNQNQI